MLLLCWCFMALQHFSGHFGHGQLIYPHCSWASLLGSLQVLSVHYFASNWQLPFLNQRKEENGRRNYFMTNLHDRMLPDVRIEPATVHIPAYMHQTELPSPTSCLCWCNNGFHWRWGTKATATSANSYRRAVVLFLIFVSFAKYLNCRRLLEKQERVDAIMASLEDEVQKEEVLQTITPAEKTQLKKVKHMVDMWVLITTVRVSLHTIIQYLYMSTFLCHGVAGIPDFTSQGCSFKSCRGKFPSKCCIIAQDPS